MTEDRPRRRTRSTDGARQDRGNSSSLALRLAILSALTLLVAPGAALAQPSYLLFESGPVRPIAVSPDGTRLFVANTPDGRLEIFDVAGAGTLSHAGTVRVGMEPVAVAARTDTEVWVVNHLSDSVSVVDLSGAVPRVVRHAAGRRRAARHRLRREPVATARSSRPRTAARTHSSRWSARRVQRARLHHWASTAPTSGSSTPARPGHLPRRRPLDDPHLLQRQAAGPRSELGRHHGLRRGASTPATRPRRSTKDLRLRYRSTGPSMTNDGSGTSCSVSNGVLIAGRLCRSPHRRTNRDSSAPRPG